MSHVTEHDARHEADAIATATDTSDAVTRLRPLLAAAAALDLQDAEAWTRLRQAARARIAVLVAGGSLPAHLAIGADDSPALVTRTIAAAWRHATSAPSTGTSPGRTDGTLRPPGRTET